MTFKGPPLLFDVLVGIFDLDNCNSAMQITNVLLLKAAHEETSGVTSEELVTAEGLVLC